MMRWFAQHPKSFSRYFGDPCLFRTSRWGHQVIRGRKRSVEELWRDLLSNTSEWWDHRPEKTNPRFPDFKHKHTHESLWLVDSRNPPWVQAELAAIPPGTLQINAFAWTQRLKRLVNARQYTKIMEVFQQMQEERICPDSWTFLPVLNACAALGALRQGKDVHTQITKAGCESDVYVATCLVDMYAKCGSIGDAWSVFNKMPEHNVVTWNAMIGGYVKSGQGLKAMELVMQMRQAGVEPDTITFVGALNACASVAALEEGRRVHAQITQVGCESDVYVATCLVDMYAKCGSIEDAWSVFSKMSGHNVAMWNAMIGGYVKSGQELKASELFSRMHQEDVRPDTVTWNTMIGGYVKFGDGLKALEILQKMQQEGVEPNAVTFVGVLNACASIGDIEEGRHVHRRIKQGGYESDVKISNCLVDMYAKCGSIEDAWLIFNKMPERNVVTWNAMIGGYVKSGQGLKAMELFQEMQQEGMEPDTVSFVGVLNACASEAALKEGRHVHTQIIQVGCESDVTVSNCLIDMYSKCGSIDDACLVFKKMREHNVVTWNAMIGGYAMHGKVQKAIELFKQMVREGVEINGITFTCLLSACSHGGLLEEGLHYFKSMTSCLNILPSMEHYACMIDLLGRAGRLMEAEDLLKQIPLETEGALSMWMSLLGACTLHGNIEMAERVAKRCWELDPRSASGCLLLSNTYATAWRCDRSAATERQEGEKCLKDPVKCHPSR